MCNTTGVEQGLSLVFSEISTKSSNTVGRSFGLWNVCDMTGPAIGIWSAHIANDSSISDEEENLQGRCDDGLVGGY